MKNRRSKGISLNKKIGTTLIAMSIIIFMLFLTLGRYEKNFFGNAKADIASAQTSIVEGKLLDVTQDTSDTRKGTMDATDTGGYFFSVTNMDKDDKTKITEVNMKYKIVVETVKTDSNGDTTYTGNVNYELYKADVTNASQPIATGQAITSTQDSDGNDVFSTSDMILKYDGNQTDKTQVDNYILKYTPDNDGQFQFKIKVISEQVD